MKKITLMRLILISLVTLVLFSCSKESTETTTDEARVRVELSFSNNYASYSWLMGFQLISTTSHVSISGHSWDETVYPDEYASWLSVRDEPIYANQYELETTAKVSAVTFNASAEIMDDASSSEDLTVSIQIYANGKLIRSESTVFLPDIDNYWSVIVSSQDF